MPTFSFCWNGCFAKWPNNSPPTLNVCTMPTLFRCKIKKVFFLSRKHQVIRVEMAKSLLECHHAKGTSPCTMLSYYYSSKWSIILRPSSWTNRSNQRATIRTPGIMLVAVAKRRCQIPQIITLDSIFAGLKYRCNFSLFSRYGNVSAFRWVNVIALGSTVTYW